MEIITNRDIQYSNLDSGGKVALATAGIGAATAIGGGLLSKQRTLSEIEQKCGKRPLFRGKKRDDWQKCADKANQPPPTTTNDPSGNKPMSKGLKIGLIVGGSILGLVIIGAVIYKLKNK